MTAVLLDFGFIIYPDNSIKYNYIKCPSFDKFVILTRKDDILAKKKYITPDDIKGKPIIFSRQIIKNNRGTDVFKEWFGCKISELNIPITYNFIFNAAIMTETGLGRTICINNLANTSQNSKLCFIPLKPEIKIDWKFAWKKGQVFSKAAKIFLNKFQKTFIKNL